MKGKKKILGLAIATFALTLSMAFAACGDTGGKGDNGGTPITPSQTITLENFTDVSKSLALGNGYELPESVLDSNGKVYEIDYTVKTESGKQLGLIGNKVFINYLETYYIVGSVEVAEGDVRTQTTTITVRDGGNPWITFGEITDGRQGVAYTLPQITVNDDSGEDITPEIKLYLLNGDEKSQEITTIENGVFTPAVGGYYYIEVFAQDSTGNEGRAYEVLYIRENTAGTTKLVTFNDQAEVDANFQFTADADRKSFEKKYIPEFAGEKNVVQVRYTGTYWTPRFSIVPTQSVAADADIFDNYTHVVLRMYTVKSEDCTNYWYDTVSMRNADNSKTVVSSTKVRQNEWVDYAFPISQLVNFSYWPIDENGNVGTNKTNASFLGHAESKIVTEDSADAAHKGVYYVAGVYVTNMAEVTATGDKVGEPAIISATVNGETLDLSNATLRVKKPNGAVVKVKGNSFTPDSRGSYEVTLFGDGFMGTKTLSFTGVDSENELISFNYDSDLSSVTVVAGGQVKWVSEYQGKQGVLRYDVTGTKLTGGTSTYTPKLTFEFMQSYEDLIAAGYTDKDYVVVEMYVVSGDDVGTTDETEALAKLKNSLYCAHGANTKYATFAKNTTERYVYNAWAEYVIPLAFFDGWATGTHNLWGELNSVDDAARMYIADIRAEKSTLTVAVEGTLTKGQTVVLSATNAENAEMDMTQNEITTVHYNVNGSRNANENQAEYTLGQAGEVVFTVEKTDSGEFGLIILNVAEAE